MSFAEWQRELDVISTIVKLKADPRPLNVQHFIEAKQTKERDDVDEDQHDVNGMSSPVLPSFRHTLPTIRSDIFLKGHIKIMELFQCAFIHRTSTSDLLTGTNLSDEKKVSKIFCHEHMGKPYLSPLQAHHVL
jgi:hypothetical protein